jgi:hypothetical protein
MMGQTFFLRWLARRTQDMPFHRPPRPSSVLASVLAAGLMLTVASCSNHITPLGPDPAATMPHPHHLRSPFVLEALRIQPPTAAGGCPAGSVALPGGPGQCYHKLGSLITITSAAVSAHLPAPPRVHGAGPAMYGLAITVPAADLAALTAVTTTAADAHGYLSISVAGRTWLLPRVLQPFTSAHFEIAFPGRNQALQLQRLLVPPG